MKSRRLLIGGILAIVIALLVTWVANKTRWEEVTTSSYLSGEALTNPFYALQKFTTELGATSERASFLTVPPVEDVIYLSSWNWDLSEARRSQIEEWVEAGGRLVMDDSVFWYDDNHFERWSRIHSEYLDLTEEQEEQRREELAVDGCLALDHRGEAFIEAEPPGQPYVVCDFSFWSTLVTYGPIDWALRDDKGTYALRVPVGKGSLTMLLAYEPFAWRALLRDDHAALFVTAAQLRAGDRLHILTEEDFPALPVLAWKFGWPVVVMLALALALALWRSATRFGPPMPAPIAARRSLAEQIRGVGRFAMRNGGGSALHAASRRALEREARRRIHGFDQLQGAERAAALARAAHVDAPHLLQAMHPPADAGPRILMAAISQLETVRRRISHQPTGHSHGR